MRTQIDSLCLFALASKCQPFSPQNLLWYALILLLGWAAMTLLYWAQPGGPAWGKYSNRRCSSSAAKLIPGPKGFPLLGSINLMLHLPHHRIAAAAHSFGAKRLMAFSLGETRALVTCNPDVAREILTGTAFCNRPPKDSAHSLMFTRAIGFAPSGVYWRTLRRISAAHLFSPKQIRATEPRRSEIAAEMAALFEGRTGGYPVREVLKRASLNHMVYSVFGRRYGVDSFEEEAEELRRLVGEGYEVLGMLNWADHLPWLADLDLQKIRFRCSKLVPRVNRFVSRIIDEHRGQNREINRDFVDVLLSLQGDDQVSDRDMVAVLWEMIFRGTDTVAVLMEWILARLVLHPEVQASVHDELDRVVGTSRAVIESDMAAMPYLRAVVKEVLRLHPPGPLLSWARLATTDTVVDGHHVPAGTTAMVNMWAIARDPEVWADPLAFKPDRFVTREGEVEFSVLGSDLRLAPFGSGRRTCPGKTLGLSTVTFWVASLLHEYEFEPSDQNGVDLSEVLKLSCEMAHPLTVKVSRRRGYTSPLNNA
ncbi:cytochrome P450 78A6 [Malania oleifera]|uniref:cytochrome P450 78A6 n=1 Tax=Malania oleifera TaxID=397392 RepID=UPI0025ADBD1B|nr:cytochrome P450 78A6 [Malania oleifera]